MLHPFILSAPKRHYNGNKFHFAEFSLLSASRLHQRSQLWAAAVTPILWGSLATPAGASLMCRICNHLQTLLVQLLLVLVLQWLQVSRLQHMQDKRFSCNHSTSTAEMRTKSRSELPVPFPSSLPQGSPSARLQPWKAASLGLGMFVHRSHCFK